jgi:hypothetical protein
VRAAAEEGSLAAVSPPATTAHSKTRPAPPERGTAARPERTAPPACATAAAARRAASDRRQFGVYFKIQGDDDSTASQTNEVYAYFTLLLMFLWTVQVTNRHVMNEPSRRRTPVDLK